MPETQAAPALKEIDLLALEIMEARNKSLAKKIGNAEKRDRVWFGDIHDCDRHNFYSMVEGDQRIRWDEFVQAKLDAGREWEQITKRELSALGYEPMLAGEVVEIKNARGEVIARGRTDCSLKRADDHRGKAYPVEMKQMQTHMWAAINNWRDLLRSPWTRKYVRQLMLYMHGKKIDEGLFHLGDFQGHWKLIPVYMDQEFIQDVLGKIERASEARDTGNAPDRIPYDTTLCGKCQFAHVCIPNIGMIPAQKIDGNDALAALLERRDQIADKGREFMKIEKAIRDFFDGIKDGLFTVGSFIITRKGSPKKTYDVPEDVKEKYAVDGTAYRNKIERFQEPSPEDIYLEPTRILNIGEDD